MFAAAGPVGRSSLRSGPFTACAACETGTWATYAGVPVYLACAAHRGPAALAYRDALRAIRGLMAASAAADPDKSRRAVYEVVGLIDEVDEPLATALRHRSERDWWQETERCSSCEEWGDAHGEAVP